MKLDTTARRKKTYECPANTKMEEELEIVNWNYNYQTENKEESNKDKMRTYKNNVREKQHRALA